VTTSNILEEIMGTNTELYAQDFYAWPQTTAALIRAGKGPDAGRPGGGRGSSMGKGPTVCTPLASPMIRAKGPVNHW
jgi:hypothetical protein